MSELSRLLGDVYGPEGQLPPDAPEERETAHAATSDGSVELHVDVLGPGNGSSAASGTAGVRRSPLPEWADDDVLDQAFEQWVPGPPSEAPAAERSMLSDLASSAAVTADSVAVAAAPVPDGVNWLSRDSSAAAASDDLRPGSSHLPAEHFPGTGAPPEVERRPWQREDDDILPAGRLRRRLR